VGLAFFFTIYLLPLLMDFWPPVANAERQPFKNAALRWMGSVISDMGRGLRQVGKYIPDFTLYLQRILDGILPLVQRNPYVYTFGFLTIFIACLYGATQVKVDSNIIEQFKEGTTIRTVYEVVDENMMGTQNMEIFLEMGSPNAFQDPGVLKALDHLQQTIASKYSHLVVRTSSLVDVVKDAYQTLNEDRPEMYVIPDNSRMLSQTLFMFNNANPEDRRKLVSDDYSKSHVSVQLYNTGSYEYINVFEEMRQDIDKAMKPLKNDYPDMKVTITGGLALIMELSDYISWSQIKSLTMVIVVISIILIFVFGSIRAGLISIIPNLIPATVTFGLLGLLGMPLDSDTMVIAPVIIGVAVDDTIHFITHYRGEVLLDGNIERALKNTIKEVGQAITFTTLILGLGFSIMAFSSHMGTSNMGKFGSLAIFAALICDLFMLPAMILIFKPRFLRKRDIQPAL
jgi:predicted RND superfamily exporter protein